MQQCVEHAAEPRHVADWRRIPIGPGAGLPPFICVEDRASSCRLALAVQLELTVHRCAAFPSNTAATPNRVELCQTEHRCMCPLCMYVPQFLHKPLKDGPQVVRPRCDADKVSNHSRRQLDMVRDACGGRVGLQPASTTSSMGNLCGRCMCSASEFLHSVGVALFQFLAPVARVSIINDWVQTQHTWVLHVQ